MPETCMTSIDVIDLYTTLANLGIEMWVDGGWGVDALLGEQTRPHKDLDIAIQQQDVSKLRALPEAQGYKEIKLEEAKPWNFVLGDAKNHEIDVHAIVFDDKGNGLYGPVERGGDVSCRFTDRKRSHRLIYREMYFARMDGEIS